jgi:DNA-binding transcriptional LysR family regulator
MALNLRHLRYFIAVAEEGRIASAAERLGMQQPPLSQQIRAIERELDVPLFRRRPRGVELTEAGRALLESARKTLAQFDHAYETTKRAARGEQGRICVGVTPTGPFHPFVPSVIRAFREAFPLVSLTLEESLTDDIVERIQNENVDAAFLRASVTGQDDLAIHPLLEEPMMAALPVGHALASGSVDTPLRLKAFANEKFILYGRPPWLGQYPAMIAACHAAGFRLCVDQEAPRITSTLGLVAAGLGISIVPASMQRINMDGVTYRRLKGAGLPKAPLLLASRSADPSPVVRNFVGLVKRAAKKFGFAQDA